MNKKGLDAPESLIKYILLIVGIAIVIGLVVLFITKTGESSAFESATNWSNFKPW